MLSSASSIDMSKDFKIDLFSAERRCPHCGTTLQPPIGPYTETCSRCGRRMYRPDGYPDPGMTYGAMYTDLCTECTRLHLEELSQT